MIPKLDLEKAYDGMDWSFLEETLINVGLPTGMINVIMGMLQKSSCRLLWNGEAMDRITPSRGLKKGGPLSPYLFVLCLEQLSQWIQRKVMEGLEAIKSIEGRP